MRSHATWTSVEESTPSNGEIVTVISRGGVENELLFDSGFWFEPKGHNLVMFYTPMFWKRMGQ